MPPKSAPSFLLTRINTSKRGVFVSRTRSQAQLQAHTQTRLQSNSSSVKSESTSSSASSPRPTPSHVGESRVPHRAVFSRGKLAAFAAEGDLLTSPSRGVPSIRPSSIGAGSGSGSSGAGLGSHQHQGSNQINPGHQSHQTRTTLPKPVLKTNPYAGNYAVSEADLAEPFEPTYSSASPPANSSDEQPTAESSGSKYSRRQQPLQTTSKGKDSLDDEGQAPARNGLGGGRYHRRRPVVRRGFGLSNTQTSNATSEVDPNLLSPPIPTGNMKRLASHAKSADLQSNDSEPEVLELDTERKEAITLHERYIVFSSKVPYDSEAVISLARLRDSCTCKLCRDPSTKQKTITTGQAVQEATAARPDISVSHNPSSSESYLSVTWYPTPDTQHMQHVPVWKLRALADPLLGDGVYRHPAFQRKLWDNATITQSPNLRIPFSEVQTRSPQTMFKLLEQLQVYGLVVIEGVPTDPTGDKDCWLRKVAGYIGEIRNTFYGETWNVKSVKQSKNVAYTDLDLGLHMDLLYFSSPPRFQALHCLRNRVNGGMSYFVDSFQVAFDLPPHIFNTLTKHKIPYVYNNDNHFLRYRHPVLSNLSVSNPHAAVNWSPPFRDIGQAIIFRPTPTATAAGGADADAVATGDAPSRTNRRTARLSSRSSARGYAEVSNVDAAQMEEKVYKAIAEFERRLAEEKYKHSFTMKEGDLVLFDNRRVLHARTAFHDKTDAEREQQGIQVVEGEPTRWLKGCYLDGEVVWDRLMVLKRQMESEARLVRAEDESLEIEVKKLEKEAKKVGQMLQLYGEAGI
ncbi:hypothetical protein I317_03074 [Kwoniella heveanensis CBS 569]|nr:hypothetical protein I317_03074 [Kwoniella heveanensis CBS 569]